MGGGKNKTSSSVKWNPEFYKQATASFGGPMNADYIQQRQVAPRSLFDPNSGAVGAGQTAQGMASLGFGNAPTTYAAPGAVNTGGPVQAAQIQVPGGRGWEGYQQDVMRSLFDPAAREVGRQGALDARALSSQVANAGLASSGSGVGQQARLQRDQSQRIQDLATDASRQASAQRFGAELDVATKQAGLTQEARQQGAQRILTGSMKDTDNYLQALNLTQKEATDARKDFLTLTGLKQADLARMDTQTQALLQQQLDNWLQQVSAMTGAGATSKGKETRGGILVG